MSDAKKALRAFAAATLVALGCRDDGTSTAIDRRSYNLGGIGAFAEMVGAAVKQLALSAPLGATLVTGDSA
ncbi:MAG: hypothetical protein JSW71_14060 [Gemmatimonadota bacterium]|nr:MAG: hypothetical protein JSW71_14060 [Gemmatimonadota bacterium]